MKERLETLELIENTSKNSPYEWDKKVNEILRKQGSQEALKELNSKKNIDTELVMEKELSEKNRRRAQLYLSLNDLKNTNKYYKKALLYDEENIILLFEYGEFLLRHNKVYKAQKIFKTAVIISTKGYKQNNELWLEKYTTSLSNLALSYKKEGRVKEAITLEEESLEIRREAYIKNNELWLEKYTTSLSNLALSYKSVGRVKEAIILVDELVKEAKRLEKIKLP